jgi:hypothetical protein
MRTVTKTCLLKTTGNALGEYILPAGVVMLLVLPILLPLRQNILSMVQDNLLGATGGKQQITVPAMTSRPEGGGSDTIGGFSVSQLLGFYRYYNADTNDLIDYQARELVETSGSNGATDVLSRTIAALATYLKENNQLTKAQSIALNNLANQGHTLAIAQKIVEDAVRNASQVSTDAGTQKSVFLDSSITYKGNTYNTVEDFTYAILRGSNQFGTKADFTTLGLTGNTKKQAVIGVDLKSTDKDAVATDLLTQVQAQTAINDQKNATTNTVVKIWAGGSELNKFIELLNIAHQSGALKQAEVNYLVSDLSYKIAQLSSGLADDVNKVAISTDQNLRAKQSNAIGTTSTELSRLINSSPTTNATTQQVYNPASVNTLSDIALRQASKLTDKNSQTICTTGNGTDAGLVCR